MLSLRRRSKSEWLHNRGRPATDSRWQVGVHLWFIRIYHLARCSPHELKTDSGLQYRIPQTSSNELHLQVLLEVNPLQFFNQAQSHPFLTKTTELRASTHPSPPNNSALFMIPRIQPPLRPPTHQPLVKDIDHPPQTLEAFSQTVFRTTYIHNTGHPLQRYPQPLARTTNIRNNTGHPAQSYPQ